MHTSPVRRYLLTATVLALAPLTGCASQSVATPDRGLEANPPVCVERRQAEVQGPVAEASQAKPRVIVDTHGRDLFAAEGVDGAFVLLDPASNTRREVNAAEVETGHIPASTFKIPNTLIGLNTGVIDGVGFALPWDGVERQVKAWNRDHDLASAMKYSVVWFYQEVARRIGEERMQQWVERFAYGNRDIGGGIDQFWLDGNLRISPREQVGFLLRLHRGELPVSMESRAIVDDITVLDRGSDYVLRGKTGLGGEAGNTVGWLVGSVERGGQRVFFATLVLAEGEQFQKVMPMRMRLTKQFLHRYGVLAEDTATVE